MYSNRNDKVSHVLSENEFIDGVSNEIIMNNQTFLPSIYITGMSDEIDLESFDIWLDGAEDLQALPLDWNKLQSYVTVDMNIELRNKSGFFDIIKPFRNCKESDFERFEMEESSEDYNLLNRQAFYGCPDITEDIADKYIVKNSYNNQTERRSFIIEYTKCMSGSCKNDTEIQRFLDDFYFTTFLVSTKMRFSKSNYG